MRVCYVVWQDATVDEAIEGGAAGANLAELHEVGFLLDENEEAIQLGMELETHIGGAGRWRLSIPKGSIKILRVVELEKAFPKRRTLKMEV